MDLRTNIGQGNLAEVILDVSKYPGHDNAL